MLHFRKHRGWKFTKFTRLLRQTFNETYFLKNEVSNEKISFHIFLLAHRINHLLIILSWHHSYTVSRIQMHVINFQNRNVTWTIFFPLFSLHVEPHPGLILETLYMYRELWPTSTKGLKSRFVSNLRSTNSN